ncbi:MAG TPA: TonB-dependent receptor, partial [Blastocatellia bacterium]|nr:TonB-dependent receptor [Blastocatellia bacterium]
MRAFLRISTILKFFCCAAFISALAASAFAQQATGNIKGTISDQQNAVIAGATVVVKNTATSAERTVQTDADGSYNVPQLQPGNYEITVTAQGFKTSKLPVALSVGDTITANLNLEVGGAAETVNVSSDTATTVNTSDFKIDGVITRQKVDNLPLNGRNFLQLASLEPGVRVSTGNPGDANSLFNVSIGGGRSALTRLTVDGGNVVDPVTGGAAQNFSVDTVQEFQLSSFNFDLATGVTSVGAVNIISRTGSNQYHGSGFAFYRDNNMAAYPALNRVASNPDPFFRRLNAGFTLGGPIVKDKLVWFTNLERLNQTTAYSTIHTGVPVLSQFDTVTSSPYRGWLYNLRADYNINDKNNAFLRYSSDNNNTFAPVGFNVLPSNWRANKNDVYQAQAGWTSSLSPTVVNELFFNYQQIANRSLVPTTSECPNCIGLGGPQIRVNNSSFRIGNPDSAPQARALYRYETTNNLTWTKGKHILKTGLNWEKAYGKGRWDFAEPGIFVTHDPRDVAAVNGAIDLLAVGLGLPANNPVGQQLRALFGPVAPALKLPLPAAFVTPGARITYQDFLGLPIAGFAAGLGDGSQPPSFNGAFARHTQRIRLYGQDTWNMGKGFTLKYGLSWVYENKLWNHDLRKSALFQSLYGTTEPNVRDRNNFAPAVGFAWDVNQNQKTVVRGGFSMAYDTSLYVNRLTERAILGPLGNGRVILPNAFYQNTAQFTQLPAQFTGALPTVAQQLTAFAQTLPATDPTRAQLLQLAG